VRLAEAGGAPRLAIAAALCFVVLVNAVAWRGQGRLASPAGAGWSPEIRAESPPLARFDAGWYRTIALRGYVWDGAAGEGNVTFFPLFPFLMGWAARLGIPLLWAGLFLAQACFLASAVLFWRLASLDGGPIEARDRFLAFLAFPWSFFLLAPYTESLFLTLVLAAWLAALHRKWALVAVLGLLAGFTRLFAVALTAGLVALLWERGDLAAPRQRWRALGAALAPAAGCAAFFAWLAVRFSDPLIFLHAQARGWGRRPGLAGLWDVLGAVPGNVREGALWNLGPAVDSGVLLLLLLAITFALWRRRMGEAAYTASAALIIAASGQLASIGRYAVVLFPVFALLAAGIHRTAIRIPFLLTCALLQIYMIVRFVNEIWVA
jgi:hypothetical protein